MPPKKPLKRVAHDLERALHIMSIGATYQPEEWALIAQLIGEADLMLRAAPPAEAAPLLPLLTVRRKSCAT
jgi:hypothetical protein